MNSPDKATPVDVLPATTRRVETYFLNGNFEATDYTLTPPTLQFASAIVYPQDLEIVGYNFGFQGTSSLTGTQVPPGTFVFPILCALVLGTQNPMFSILNPVVGQAITQIIAFLNGANAYIPASTILQRPELVAQTGNITWTAPLGHAIRVPANTPVSLYLGPSNNGPFDAVSANAVLYMTKATKW